MYTLFKKWACPFAIVFSLFSQTTFAHTGAEEMPDESVKIELAFVSNFIHRGNDMGARYSDRNGDSYGSWTAPGFFQPRVTFSTPLPGLYFDMAGSFAMQGRGDKDIDQRLETSSSGNDTHIAHALVHAINNKEDFLHVLEHDLLGSQSTWPKTGLESLGVRSFYKDETGLSRNDSIEFTLGYKKLLRYGLVDFGLQIEGRPGTLGKPASHSHTETTSSTHSHGGHYHGLTTDPSLVHHSHTHSDIFLAYGLPFFPELTIRASSDIQTSEQYYLLEYRKVFELGEHTGLEVSLGHGYSVQDKYQGMADSPFYVGLNLSGFSIGVGGAYRGDLATYDPDTDTKYPLWLDGGSTKRDGLVVDPSRYYGWENDLINALIERHIQSSAALPNYVYTPRQKLPRWLYYTKIAYTAIL